MAPFDRSHATSYWRSIFTMALFCIISEIKREIGRKSRFLHTSPASHAPIRGRGMQVKYVKSTSKLFRRNSWDVKTKMVHLSEVKSSRIWLLVLIQYTNVADWHPASQPDKQTLHDGIGCAMKLSCSHAAKIAVATKELQFVYFSVKYSVSKVQSATIQAAIANKLYS